jgi:hypothetical protein
MEEFRIKYVHDHAVTTSYHYYLADSAEQALSFQDFMAEKKHWDIETISIERYDRFADKWKEIELTCGPTDSKI